MPKPMKYSLFTILLASLLLFGCRKESTFWEDDFVAPLAKGNLSLGNMFPDTTIKTNPDSSLKIAFETQLINFGMDSLLKIPDTTITNVAKVPFSFTVSPNTTLLQTTSSTYYDFPNGILLSKSSIKFGKVKVELYNTARQPLSYHYQLLSAFKNNVMLDTVFEIPPGIYSTNPSSVCVTPGTLTDTIDLSGYDIDFTGASNNTNNTVNQFGEVKTSTLAVTDTIFANTGLTSNFTFMGIVPQYAQGYFGNQLVQIGPDSASFDVFNTIQSGILNLNSATVQLKIVNEFGVVMRTTIGNLKAVSTANNQTVTINGSNSTPLASPININGGINTGSGSIAATKTVTLNNINTPSITNFIGILPDKFYYDLSAQLNPYGNLSGNTDFAYYGTGFKVYMNADIPLHFSATDIVLLDTMPLDLSGVSQFDNINYGQLILTAQNSYPFSINLQGYLLDANKNIIDQLFNAPNTLAAPMLDANFKVIAPIESKLFVPLNKNKIANLRSAKYIYYSARFNTAAQPNQIKFYSHYTLGLLLTADINYTIGK